MAGFLITFVPVKDNEHCNQDIVVFCFYLLSMIPWPSFTWSITIIVYIENDYEAY